MTTISWKTARWCYLYGRDAPAAVCQMSVLRIARMQPTFPSETGRTLSTRLTMKTTKTDRAQVAQVIIAGSTFEGVMFPDGSYGITIQQAHRVVTEGIDPDETQITVYPTHAQRDLKTLLSMDSPFTKEYVSNNSRSQNVLTLEQFWQVLRKLDRKGNPIATAFIDACGENTLQMYLDDAFGIERATKERITWLEVRMAGIVARTSATDALRDALLATGQTPQAFHYIRLTEDLNQAALGFTAAQYKRVHGLETRVNMRERLTKDQLRALEFAEELFVKLLPKSADWQEALSKTIETVSE